MSVYPWGNFFMDLNLHQVEVRPILPNERRQWIELCQAHHYLGYSGSFGYQILYCAHIDNTWVGLLAFSACALALKSRDDWIGWSPAMRSVRSNLIVNNSRFLVTPNSHNTKNLASRVLSLAIKRLAADWREAHNLEPVLVETFVDPSRFNGTCYRAAGWTEIGMTAGYKRVAEGFAEGSGTKKIFVMPLRKDALEILRSPWHTDLRGEEHFLFDPFSLPIEGQDGLIDTLKTISDPRSRMGRQHSFVSILGVTACGMLAGARTFDAIGEWSKNLSKKQLEKLRCRMNRAPSLTTIKETLYRIDCEEFDRKINAWLARQALKNSQARCIAVDGKTLRGSSNSAPKKPAIQLLSALLHDEKIVVAQRVVEQKTNEIGEVKSLLANMDLSGVYVTLDALHCQKDTMSHIHERGGHFVITVKNNQKTLLNDIKDLFELYGNDLASTCEEKSKGHGRVETRQVQSVEIDPAMAEMLGFPHIRQVCKIDRFARLQSKKIERQESVYVATNVTAAQAPAATMLSIVRQHWRIENSSHHVRDVTFQEDSSQIRTGSAPRVMATFRNLAIGVMRLGGEENIASGLRNNAWAPKSATIRALGLK